MSDPIADQAKELVVSLVLTLHGLTIPGEHEPTDERMESNISKLSVIAQAALDESRAPLLAEITALRATIMKEREAVARFLIPHRRRLAECWLDHFKDEGLVIYDEIGAVSAAPLPQSLNRPS